MSPSLVPPGTRPSHHLRVSFHALALVPPKWRTEIFEMHRTATQFPHEGSAWLRAPQQKLNEPPGAREKSLWNGCVLLTTGFLSL